MRLSLAQPQGRLFWGQAVLVACCLFYVCFWRAAFHPYRSAAVPFGGKAALFLCTLLCGIGGVALTVSGVGLVGKKPVSQALLVVGGAAAYVVLLFLTTLLWKRRVTTELVLLVAWTVLELSALKRLVRRGLFWEGRHSPVCGAVRGGAFGRPLVLFAVRSIAAAAGVLPRVCAASARCRRDGGPVCGHLFPREKCHINET